MRSAISEFCFIDILQLFCARNTHYMTGGTKISSEACCLYLELFCSLTVVKVQNQNPAVTTETQTEIFKMLICTRVLFCVSYRFAGSTWSLTRVTAWRTTTVNWHRCWTRTTWPPVGCSSPGLLCRTSCPSCGPCSTSCCPPSSSAAAPSSSGLTHPSPWQERG